MNFKDVLSLYFERTNSMQTFWNFYNAIALALIAFFGSAHLGKGTWWVASILSAAFIGFAGVNLGELHDVNAQRREVADLVRNWPSPDSGDSLVLEKIKPTLRPSSWGRVLAVHIAGDLLTLAAIWSLALMNASTPASPH